MLISKMTCPNHIFHYMQRITANVYYTWIHNWYDFDPSTVEHWNFQENKQKIASQMADMGTFHQFKKTKRGNPERRKFKFSSSGAERYQKFCMLRHKDLCHLYTLRGFWLIKPELIRSDTQLNRNLHIRFTVQMHVCIEFVFIRKTFLRTILNKNPKWN